jgi:hypothetical protein
VRRPPASGPLLAAALAALACGGDPAPDPLPRNTWTWVDLPGTACSDGSRTGVAVNRGDGPDVLLFLDGGGACWETVTCFTAGTASPGPYGRAQFEAQRAQIPGSILDRALPGNPFARHTLVFVPYCTGDVHAGDAVRDYPGAPRPWHHKGRVNVERVLEYLAAPVPAPPEVVVSGASAGGFGALMSYDAVRRRWPAARGYLVDDSGATPVGNDLSPVIRAAWILAWRLDESLLELCPACANDLSALFPLLAARYPEDRLALLSTTHDVVMRGFFVLDAPAFEAMIGRLAEDVIAPLPNARTFLVPGTGHTMLGAPAGYSADGVPLVEWLRQEVEDDPGWSSAGP